MQVSMIHERKPAAGPRFALFDYGFRLFFLVAGIYAWLAVPLWVAVLVGLVDWAPPRGAMAWHAHEMVFGYTMAVIAGFLLTATANWTQHDVYRRPVLVALAATWLAGRIAFGLAGALLPPAVAAIDLAFVPMLAGVIGVPLLRARQRRQYVLLAVLAALFGANALTHLEALGIAWADGRRGVLLAVNLAVLLIAVMGGRIIPSFTRNALRPRGAAEAVVSPRWLDRIAILAVVAVMLVDLVAELTPWAGIIALLAAAAHGVRLAGWQPLRTLDQPILWVLHLGYAWLPVGFLLKGLAAFAAAVPAGAGLHALTVGAIGMLTLGVMSRAALGHTGRALIAHPATIAAYALVAAATVFRVLVPIAWPEAHALAVGAAGTLWALAFLLFTAVYLPILCRPRIDGRPG